MLKELSEIIKETGVIEKLEDMKRLIEGFEFEEAQEILKKVALSSEMNLRG